MGATDQTESADARAALRHPLWWAALALLLLNDHALKGAGLLPGWLTGKLSDLAGLVVAPVLLAALVRARTRRGLLGAFGAVAGWFVAVNLSPAASGAMEGLMGALGVPWRLWSDPTDLIALAALPLGWHISARAIGRGRPSSPGDAAVRAALVLGVFACVATAPPPPPNPGWTARAWITNRTEEPVAVRVRWIDASMDCVAVQGRFAEALDPSAFSPGTTFVVAPGRPLPLDRDLATGGDTTPPPGPVVADAGTGTGPDPDAIAHRGSCDAVLISADGLEPQIVFWQGLTPVFVPEEPDTREEETLLLDGLELLPDGDALSIGTPSGSRYALASPMERLDASTACVDWGVPRAFGWSSFEEGEAIFDRVEVGVDGCVSLEWRPASFSGWSPDPRRSFVCVPPEDFPFASGDEVRILRASAEQLRIVRALDDFAGGTRRVAELAVFRAASSLAEGPFRAGVTQVYEGCTGERLDCGAYRVAGALGISEGSSTRFVHPGEAMETDAPDGRRARLRVGRSEQIVVARSECGASRAVLGDRIDALVVYGEETR